MKKMPVFLASFLLLVSSISFADTSTSRMGLIQPTTSFGDVWGAKYNNTMATIDSSAAVQGVQNNFTSTNTFTQDINLAYGSPSQCLATNSNNDIITQACAAGAGGSNALAIYVGFTNQISSPTPFIVFSSNTLTGRLLGSTTAFIDLNPATTYFIQNGPLSQQAASLNIATGTIGNLLVSTLTVTSSGTIANVNLTGTTLAYSSGTFLNSIVIGTTNANGQAFRTLVNSNGTGSLESPLNQTIFWNLRNNTSSTPANFVSQVMGSGGDSATGALAGDGEIKTANNLYVAAGGATTKASIVISSATGTVGISSAAITKIFWSDGSIQVSSPTSSSGSGTVNSGTATQLAYYPSSTNAISGLPNATMTPTDTMTFSNTTHDLNFILDGSVTSGHSTIFAMVTSGNSYTWTNNGSVLNFRDVTHGHDILDYSPSANSGNGGLTSIVSLNMAATKITNMLDGTSATDAATVGQTVPIGSSLSPGTTMYISSGTINTLTATTVSVSTITASSETVKTLNVTSIKFPDGTIQVSSPTSGGGGGGSVTPHFAYYSDDNENPAVSSIVFATGIVAGLTVAASSSTSALRLSFDSSITWGGPGSYQLTFFVDGSNITLTLPAGDGGPINRWTVGSSGTGTTTLPFHMETIYIPGDTSAHTYDIGALTTGDPFLIGYTGEGTNPANITTFSVTEIH